MIAPPKFRSGNPEFSYPYVQLSRDQLNTIRQRIWNKSLATVVIDVRGDTAVALPVRRLKNAQEHLDL